MTHIQVSDQQYRLKTSNHTLQSAAPYYTFKHHGNHINKAICNINLSCISEVWHPLGPCIPSAECTECQATVHYIQFKKKSFIATHHCSNHLDEKVK